MERLELPVFWFGVKRATITPHPQSYLPSYPLFYTIWYISSSIPSSLLLLLLLRRRSLLIPIVLFSRLLCRWLIYRCSFIVISVNVTCVNDPTLVESLWKLPHQLSFEDAVLVEADRDRCYGEGQDEDEHHHHKGIAHIFVFAWRLWVLEAGCEFTSLDKEAVEKYWIAS